MLFRFIVLIALLFALSSAFQPAGFNARSFLRSLEMAKKSVGDLTEADLKGKRY